MRHLAFFAITAACFAQARAVRPDELPPSLRRDGWLEAIERATAQRLRDGEWDHLIYYALQSRAFTNFPPIEPAKSALAFHTSGRIPLDASRRLDAFLSAKPGGARHTAMRGMAGSRTELDTEYRRAMTFLYRKEWEAKELKGPEHREFVGRLYQSRGHSSDTSLWAGRALEIAMNILRGLRPGQRIDRVLLAGPGLDWAPRTGLLEDGQPKSYQPEALRLSIQKLGMAANGNVRIDCVDVNPRVVDALRSLGWNAQRMNILTQRMAPEAYDLAVVTNVLLYFDNDELGLALANLTYSLKPGGLLLHNELRPQAEEWGRRLGWPVLHASTHSPDGDQGVFDALVFHAVKR